MGGEPGTILIRFAPNQRLPEGYEVVWVDGLYWWQNSDGDCDGEVADRYAARRMAIEHHKKKQAAR